jgi:hypothetical protein
MLRSKFSLSRHFEYANEQTSYHFWLCVTFTKNGKFKLAKQKNIEKVTKAMYEVTGQFDGIKNQTMHRFEQYLKILQLYHENSRFPPSFKF